MLSSLANALLLAVMLSFSHALLKWLSVQNAESHLQLLLRHWWILGLAIGIYVLIFLYYTYVLSYASISILYPVYTGLSILFVFLIGVVYFKEPYSGQHLLGCLLVVLGIFLMSGVRL